MLLYSSSHTPSPLSFRRQVQISTGLGNVTEALQSERAEIAFFLFTNGSVIRRNLSEHFQYTNQLIDDLKWPKFRIGDQLFQNKILFRIRLDDFRDKITRFDTPSIDAGIQFYNRANYIFLDQLTREIKEKDASGMSCSSQPEITKVGTFPFSTKTAGSIVREH